MAFVPGHKFDLFVSYAIVDNQRGWVTALVRELKIQLAAWLGRSDAFDVWWDRTDLDEAGALDDQIGRTLDQTAALVVVLSRAYMASPWCKEERRLFLEAVRHRELSDNRTFLVDLGNLDVEDRPNEFSKYRTRPRRRPAIFKRFTQAGPAARQSVETVAAERNLRRR